MTGIHPTRCTRQLTSFQGQYWRHCTALQWLEKGYALFLSLVMLPAMVLLASLCIVSPGQAQTPETTDFRTAIYRSYALVFVQDSTTHPQLSGWHEQISNSAVTSWQLGRWRCPRSPARAYAAGRLRRSLLTGEEGR